MIPAIIEKLGFPDLLKGETTGTKDVVRPRNAASFPQPAGQSGVCMSLTGLDKQDVMRTLSAAVPSLLRDGAAVAHLAHNQKVGGSNPSPATNHQITAFFKYEGLAQ